MVESSIEKWLILDHSDFYRLSEEAWGDIWHVQWSSTNSMDWGEHCWKNIIRCFKTPQQEKYRDVNMPCCGSVMANYFHIFWECPKLKLFWKSVHDALGTIFDTQCFFISLIQKKKKKKWED